MVIELNIFERKINIELKKIKTQVYVWKIGFYPNSLKWSQEIMFWTGTINWNKEVGEKI